MNGLIVGTCSRKISAQVVFARIFRLRAVQGIMYDVHMKL